MKTACALRIIRGPLEKHTLAGNTVGILFAEGSDADALIKLTADIADAGGVAKLIALATLMQGGAAFVVEPVLDDPTDDQRPQAGWPVALVGANGSFTLFSPEQEDVAISGDMVVKLYQPSSTAIVGLKQKRRFALYRRVAAS